MFHRCFPLRLVLRRCTSSAVMIAALTLALSAPAAADLWTPLGPPGGVVTAVAVDPGDGNTVYAGTPEAGVFWSRNGGRLWLRTGLDGAGQVSWLGVVAGSGRVYAIAGDSLYRSAGSGAPWTALAPGLRAAGVAGMLSVALPPGAPDTLYLVGRTDGGDYRVFKSTDGGDSWTVSFVPPAGLFLSQAIADPNDSQTVFVTTGAGVYRTVDGGVTWTAGDLPGLVRGLAVERGPRRRLLAWELAGDPRLPQLDVFYVSSDHGLTWRPGPSFNGGFLQRLVTDPTAPGAFYAADFLGDLRHTADFGLHWQTEGPVPHGGPVYDLAADPVRPGVAFLAVDGSRLGRTLWKTANYGAAWTLFQNGIFASDFPFVVPDPTNPATLWAGAGSASGTVPGVAPYGVFKSADRGTSWVPAGLPTVSVQTLAFGPGQRIFAATVGNGLQRSDDGQTWRRVPGPGNFILALASPAAAPATLYVLSDHGTTSELDLSLDNGATFTSRSVAAQVLGLAPGAPATLYADLTTDPSLTTGSTARDGVQRTTDRGTTWTKLVDFVGVVRAIAVDPPPQTIPRRIIAAFEHLDENNEIHGGVETSLDDGVTWTEASLGTGSPGVLSLLPDPLVPHGFLAGTRAGVFTSPDGVTWTLLGEGLPQVPVVHLSTDPSAPHTLYAATAGGGIYLIKRTTP
jgi:hypothetical protein